VQGAVGATGPSGTASQSASLVFQTAQLTMTVNTGLTLIPGLADTVVMPPAGTTFHVNVCGEVGVTTTSGAANGFSDVTVLFMVDSARAAAAFPAGFGGFATIAPTNTSAVTDNGQTWSQCYTFPNGVFAAGSTHTFQMAAFSQGIGSTATVGSSPAQDLTTLGQMWVEVIEE
jgi:hypothetical protein